MPKQQPQLQMLWPESAPMPEEPSLPEGYRLRLFAPEDTAEYLRLMHGAGFTSFTEETVAAWQRRVLPDGWFVVEHTPTGEIVATTLSSHRATDLHPAGGELGWVAGDNRHGGRGLGFAVCAAVVRRFRQAGYRRIYLSTDDWRLPAIKVYLKLGFVPFLFAADMPGRWQAVCEQLHWPFTPDAWPAVPFPPVAEDEPEARPDAVRPDRYARRVKWLPNRPHRGYSQTGDVAAFGDESLYHPSRLGVASVAPGEVAAGDVSPLRLTYTAGAAGLPEGARVTFVMRGQSPLGKGFPCFQAEGPASCEVEANHAGFALKRGTLAEGQSVTLTAEPFPWTPLAGRREFNVVINYGDNVPEQRLPEPLVITVLPGAVARLEATVPCTHRQGETIPFLVTTRDAFDNRVPRAGAVEIDGQSVPLVDGTAAGHLAPSSAGVARVTARVRDLNLECASNPSLATDDLHLFIGDLHCHDFLSEAEGYTDAVYQWARDERRLDFLSVSPQAHGWLDNETWTIARYMNERYLREGEFVTLLGFEWQHTGYGDKVVHYLGGDQPYLPVDDERYASAAGLYAALRESDALVISHHPCYPEGSWCASTDFACVETDVERLVELWSMHGSSEGYDPADRPLRNVDPERQVMAALRRGLRLGFVAGSDTHSGRPGGSAKEPLGYWGGLAAVWAERLTRRDLFAALWRRQTYALTGARIILRFTVNGALMGAETPAADRADIRIDAWTPGRLAKVELLKNTRVLQEFHPGGDECHLQVDDAPGGPAFYHARVTQTDGELAVCSPVWVG